MTFRLSSTPKQLKTLIKTEALENGFKSGDFLKMRRFQREQEKTHWGVGGI